MQLIFVTRRHLSVFDTWRQDPYYCMDFKTREIQSGIRLGHLKPTITCVDVRGAIYIYAWH